MGLEQGAIYSGEQLTNTGSFKIEMRVDTVDFAQQIMYGTFKIYNLSDKHEELCSFFESVIVGNKYKFFEDAETDAVHWGMFPEWRREWHKAVHKFEDSDYIYMKIKELFLLPDPKVKSIPGASIDGFYYCCYYRKLDCFAGHYYFKNSTNQISQQILLERVQKRTKGQAAFA